MSGLAPISEFVRRLERLATPERKRQLSQKLGGDIIRLINDQIDRGVDPYGQQWKRRVDDGASPLRGLRGTFSASVSEGRVRVTSSKWYALVHQAGWTIRSKNAPTLRFRLPSGRWVSKMTVVIPRRQLIPSATDGLSERWTERLMATSDQFFRDHLQGR